MTRNERGKRRLAMLLFVLAAFGPAVACGPSLATIRQNAMPRPTATATWAGR